MTDKSDLIIRYLKKLWIILIGFVILLSMFACTPSKVSNTNAEIQAAVAATIASLPSATPIPQNTPSPTQTPHTIKDVFCEYDFCIGHPPDIYLMDQGSTRQPPVPSTYSYGIIFGYSQNLFIEMAWTTSSSNFDPQSTMRYILEENESLHGNLNAELISGINVYHQPISTVSSSLPYGGIASWQCNGRDFAWKVYTPQDGISDVILRQALEKFQCIEK